MREIRSEYLSQKLYIAMSIIILSLCSLSIPLMVKSYRDYIKTNQALTEIQALQAVADLANKISRERAPANKLMSSNQQDFAKHDIMLNSALVLFPEAITRYVCVHELAHTQHFDHSARFWAEVAKYDAAFQQHRKTLKTTALPHWWASA